VDTEAVVEAVAGLAMKPLSSDLDGSSSDIISEWTSNEEGMLLASSSGEAAAEVDPSSPAPIKAVVEAELALLLERNGKLRWVNLRPLFGLQL